MVLLELVIIGGAVYYYKKHHKEKSVFRQKSCSSQQVLMTNSKARKIALLSGQPFQNRNGTVIYPPAYPGLPDVPPAYAGPGTSCNRHRDQPREHYSDVPVNVPVSSDEKAPLMVQSRSIEVREEKS